MVGFAIATPATARGWTTKEFKKGTNRPQRLALLPPHADFVKAKAVMTEQMIKECQALEAASVVEIRQHLQELGYEVKVVTQEEVNASTELHDLVDRAHKRYDEEKALFSRKPKKIKKHRYSLGDEGVLLTSALDVDGLVIARINAVWVSGGAKALSVLFGGLANYQRSHAYVDMTIVDGETGDVELYYVGIDPCKSEALVNEPEKVIRKAYNSCFQGYPKKGAVVAEGTDEDDEMLEDLEEMLAEEEDGGSE